MATQIEKAPTPTERLLANRILRAHAEITRAKRYIEKEIAYLQQAYPETSGGFLHKAIAALDQADTTASLRARYERRARKR